MRETESVNNNSNPVLGVVLGSDSDLTVMLSGLELLEEWAIPFEVRILSAHRTPDAAQDYGKSAAKRGLKVLIAAAGMAAHLPGVLASYTMLPVIGVPIASGHLQGNDALYAMVQMPPGIPVATVGINAGKNAALLAVQLLSLAYPIYQKKLKDFRDSQCQTVISKDAELARLGFRCYNVAHKEIP
ncbi:MAG: 5-(carboxyamino)imidazole ribonucleotide mutase [Firmicutes bacterium]|nr:5-(carboxyamino)imidazole ribonucleotide mutase [Bacillota bacterium]